MRTLIFSAVTLAALGLALSAAVLGPTTVAEGDAEQSTNERPQRTTASYDAWELVCVSGGDEAAGERCEMNQRIRVQGQAEPVARITVGRPAADEPRLMIFHVPVGVWLPAGVVLDPGDGADPLTASFGRCLPGACLASLALDAATAERLAAASSAEARFSFEIQEGQPAQVAMSFAGFKNALAQMDKR